MATAYKIGEAYVDIGTRQDGLDKGLKQTKTKVSDLGKSFASVATNIAVVTAASYGFYRAFIKPASDAIEINNKFAVTFRDVAKEADAAALALSEGYGLARAEAKKLLSDTGDLLTGFGLTGGEALKLSNQVQELAVDLASFTNIEGGAQRASEALTKAMLGEREMTKALGIVISEKAIKDKLVASGQEKLTGNALLQAKAYATLEIAVEQSKNAIGDFERSSNSTANVGRVLLARMQDLRVEIGAELLPGLTQLGRALIDLMRNGTGFIEFIKDAAGAVSDLFSGLANVVDAINYVNIKLQQTTLNNIAERINGVKDSFKELYGIRNLHSKQAQEIAKHDERARLMIEQYTKLLNEYNKKRQEYGNLQQRAVDISKRVNNEVNNETQATKKNTKALKENAEANKEVNKEREKFLEDIDKRSQDFGVSEVQRLERQKQEELEKLDSYYSEAEKLEIQFQTRRKAIVEFYDTSITETRLNNAQTWMGYTSDILSQIGELFTMNYENQLMEVDNEYTVKMERIAEWYETQKAAIENSTDSEKKKNKKLEALDKQRARKEKEVEDKRDKETRKIQREQAQTQKAMAIFSAVINTAAAIVGFLVNPGGYAGIALAVVAAALGAAQIAMIAAEPLPVAAKGGLSYEPAIFGEAGPEVAIPLSGTQGQAALRDLSNAMLDTMAERHKDNRVIEPTVESGNITNNNMAHITVMLGSETLYDDITKASENGEIRIHARSIVN